MAALARFSRKTLTRQNSLASLVLRREISAECSPALPPKVFLARQLTIFRSNLRLGIRSNIQVRSVIFGSKFSPPAPKHWFEESSSSSSSFDRDENVLGSPDCEFVTDVRGWIKREDPRVQFSVVISREMREQNILEIPESFVELNGMEKGTPIRFYGKGGCYYTCNLKEENQRYFASGRAIAMYYEHLHLKIGSYMVFKLKVDSLLLSDGIHRIFVMKIEPPPKKEKKKKPPKRRSFWMK